MAWVTWTGKYHDTSRSRSSRDKERDNGKEDKRITRPAASHNRHDSSSGCWAGNTFVFFAVVALFVSAAAGAGLFLADG
jgi:hypothetical protein